MLREEDHPCFGTERQRWQIWKACVESTENYVDAISIERCRRGEKKSKWWQRPISSCHYWKCSEIFEWSSSPTDVVFVIDRISYHENISTISLMAYHSFCMTIPLFFNCQRVVLIHTPWYYLPGVFGALNTSVCFAGVSLSGWDPFCFSRTRSISLWMEVKVRGFFSFVLWALTDDTFWVDKVQQQSLCSE